MDAGKGKGKLVKARSDERSKEEKNHSLSLSQKKKKKLLSSIATMRLAPSCSLASSPSRLRLATASSTQPRRRPATPPAATPNRQHRRPSLAASAQQQASDARSAIDAGIELMQAGDPRAALAEFGRALTLPGTGLKRYRCVRATERKTKAKAERRSAKKARSKKKG